MPTTRSTAAQPAPSSATQPSRVATSSRRSRLRLQRNGIERQWLVQQRYRHSPSARRIERMGSQRRRPIVKDRLFFFSDYEGLRYVLPASGFVSVPTSSYEGYALGTVPAAATSTYNQMFGCTTTHLSTKLRPCCHCGACRYHADAWDCRQPRIRMAEVAVRNTRRRQIESGTVPTNQPTPLGGLYDIKAPDGGTLGVTESCVGGGFARPTTSILSGCLPNASIGTSPTSTRSTVASRWTMAASRRTPTW